MPKSSNISGEDPKRAAPKKRSAVRRAKPVAHAKPPKQAAAHAVKRGPSLLLSPDEKREMIMAHAAMRQTRDPVQMASLWAGVAVAFVVIVGAWGWAFGPSLLQAAGHPVDPVITQTVEGAAQVKDQVDAYTQNSALKHELDQASAQLDALSSQTTVEQQTVSSLAATVNSSTPAAPRDVFQPPPASAITKPVTP